MAIGTYPFRCLDCNGRFPVNVLLLSRLAYAKCSKCLSLELTTWPRKGYHVSLLKKLMLTFGARRYRCASCRHNFVSFRPLAVQQPPVDKGLQEEPVPGEDLAVSNEAEAETHPEIR